MNDEEPHAHGPEHRGRGRRWRPCGHDARRRAHARQRRRRRRRTPRDPGSGEPALARPARSDDRSPRSARDRRPVPGRRHADAGAGLRRDTSRHQRLPDPTQLRPGARPERLRTDHGGMARRARGSDHARLRGHRSHLARRPRRGHPRRRRHPACRVPRGLRRQPKPRAQEGRHRVRRLGPKCLLDHR